MTSAAAGEGETPTADLWTGNYSDIGLNETLESVARTSSPASLPASATITPSRLQIAERPTAGSKPPPVEPAKLAIATQT